MKEWGGAEAAALTAAVLARDEGICRIDGPKCRTIATTADHIVPRSKGGTDDMSNLQAACLPCNLDKSDKYPDDPPVDLPEWLR